MKCLKCGDKEKNLYLLNKGRYWDGASYTWVVVTTKQEAQEFCKERGYKWDSKQQLFCNDMARSWVRINHHTLGDSGSGTKVSYGRT